MRRACAAGAALLLALTSTFPTEAQEPTASPTPTREETAHALHRRGAAAYDASDFDAAIEAFRAAYALSPSPGVLFNLAQAYRGKGAAGCADALRIYRAYLQQVPDAANRQITLEHIADMERCVQAQAPPRREDGPPPATSAPAAAPRHPPPAASGGIPWVTVVIGGVGVAAGIVGAALLGSAASEYDRFEQQCAKHDCDPDSWKPYETRETIGVAMLGGGAAMAVGAAVLWLVMPSKASTSALRKAPATATVRF